MGLFTPNIRSLDKADNIKELVKCLDHRAPHVRYGAFVALAGRNYLSSVILNRLKKMTGDPDPWIRSIAILKFAEMGDPSVSDNLMEIMLEGSADARIVLLKIIADRGASLDHSIAQIIMNGLSDKKEIVRKQAIIAAAATGNRHLVPHLARRLREEHHDLRIQTANSLFEIGGGESADYLIGLLADRNGDVRDAARSHLEHIEYDYVKKALHDQLFTSLIAGMNGTEPVRRATVEKIGSEAIREGLPLLHKACRDKYKGVRLEALRSIMVFRSPSSVMYVAELMRDRFRDVRLEAVKTLEKIGGPSALEALQKGVDDHDRYVRETAYRAMARIKQNL